ncbi:alpha/beta fold hydrolase [Legionella sp. CNM-4043-24]|uniref:alpha/beta fold hydrolase n=1 Tax=Legionella sp. CNM-4043-24 TaxID=3421646 RepID=UPI00403AE104
MSSFKKRTIEHPYLYIVSFTQNRDLPCLVFVHGGPGLNCGVLEYMIEQDGIFDALEYDIILYDQRGCGRSRFTIETVRHIDNLCDLQIICELVISKENYDIAGLIGHSYGAKLVYDYLHNRSHNNIPGIFISTASSISVPRINNLLLDLMYLKTVDVDQYQEIINNFDEHDYDNIWNITVRLESIFITNPYRALLYWANLEIKDRAQKIQNNIGLSRNENIFISVREDLYSISKNYSVDIDQITDVDCLWINGFHDYIVNRAGNTLPLNTDIMTFYKSSHYPHIEEPERFIQEINNFIKNIRN